MGLIDNLRKIRQDKNSNLKSENLRKGVSCLGIDGSQEPLDITSDATAIAADILKDKTAYVNSVKVTGTLVPGEGEGTSSGFKAPSHIRFEGITETEYDFNDLDVSGTTNLNRVFYACRNLTKLGVDKWDVSSVTTMEYAFYQCQGLTELDLSSWDVQNVTSLNYAFQYLKLPEINLSGWNTKNLKTIIGAFCYLSGVKKVDLSNWDTSSLENTSTMFTSPGDLEEIDLTGWNFSNCTNVSGMFQGCTKLTTLTLPEVVDLRNCTNISGLFKNCYILADIDTSKILISNKVTSLNGFFVQCGKITSVDLSTWDGSSISDIGSMFYMCRSLTDVNFGWTSTALTTMSGVFNECQKLQTVTGFENISTENVTNMSSLFNACTTMTDFGFVSNFNTQNVTTMSSMFSYCYAVTRLDLSNFDTSKVTDMNYMFRQCKALITLDISNFDMSKVTKASSMFQTCTMLTDDSLNSILKAFSTATALSSSYKTLKYQGLTSDQATICTGLSNWAACEAIGWTTGY